MANITLAQMLKYEFVLGIFSRLASPATQLSSFYGMRPESPGTERALNGRNVGWDIFDNTRTMAKARSPYSGPASTRLKPTGHVSATLVRLYEKIDIIHEKVYGTRPLGAQYGDVDRTGQTYVGRQIKYAAQRTQNTMEFMVSRMFRGGFAIEVDGEDHFLREKNAGTVNVDYQIPPNNIGRVPELAGGDPVIDADWDVATTDIASQLLNLNKVSERLSGLPITEFWINSTTLGYLYENNQLASVAGSSARIFDTLTGQEISTVDDGSRPSGITVVFRAMPQYKFHIYDAVLNVDSQVDSSVESDTSLFIPDGRCIATPHPSMTEWRGTAVGSEPIRENDESEVVYKEGFSSWSKRMNDPPGEELRTLTNILPILYIPSAVFYLTVDT